MSPPILADYKRNGRTIKGLIDVARDGYLWFLERSDGPIKFVEGTPFVKQNVFKSLDPKTGRPDVDPDHKPGTGKQATFCPSLWGGKNWPPVAFSPKTRMIYIPANENLCETMIGAPVSYSPGQRYVGATYTFSIAAGADHVGEVQAWNIDTGKRVWTHTYADVAELGPDARDRRRTGVFRRDQRPRVPRVRRGDRQAAVEVPDQLGDHRPADVVSRRRPSVRRRAVRLGRRFAGHGDAAEHPAAGRFPEVPEGGAIWVFAIK